MTLARDAVLWAADHRWLREHLPKYRFVRRSVRRFMPGETLEDAIAAATRLRERGLPTMFTALGENVTELSDAQRVVANYRDAYDRAADAGLDTEFSVKPSHLGLDLDPEAALANLEELGTKAAERDNWLWLDMESADYVDGTLDLYRKLRAGRPNVGVCLQAYLKRTADDVAVISRLRSASLAAETSAGAVAATSALCCARRSESVIEGTCSPVMRRCSCPNSTKEIQAMTLAARVSATAPAIAT